MDQKRVFMELKRSNGYDVQEDEVRYDAWFQQYWQIKKALSFGRDQDIKSVYEVGCGCGASLYLFEQDGIAAGGIDYSEPLIQGAKKVLRSTDLVCGEATQTPPDTIYEAVFSNCAFVYFTDESYAWEVLERMYEKAEYSIGIIDVYDKAREEICMERRKKSIEDYDEKYKDLPKLFYPRQFFEDFAEKHHMDIRFIDPEVGNYWNSDWSFDCYMYKKG